MKVAGAGTGSLVLLHLELLATGCTSSVMHRAVAVSSVRRGPCQLEDHGRRSNSLLSGGHPLPREAFDHGQGPGWGRSGSARCIVLTLSRQDHEQGSRMKNYFFLLRSGTTTSKRSTQVERSAGIRTACYIPRSSLARLGNNGNNIETAS